MRIDSVVLYMMLLKTPLLIVFSLNWPFQSLSVRELELNPSIHFQMTENSSAVTK